MSNLLDAADVSKNPMSDQAKAFAERYHRALERMQTAVAFEIATGQASDTTPKHLRVGVNNALSADGALCALLIAKGLITWEEVYEAKAILMEQEVKSYEAQHAPMRFGGLVP